MPAKKAKTTRKSTAAKTKKKAPAARKRKTAKSAPQRAPVAIYAALFIAVFLVIFLIPSQESSAESGFRNPLPTLSPIGQGMSGQEVLKVQECLYNNGFLEDEPDGYYGEKTASAVKQLQKYINDNFSAGENEDGIVSRRLYNSLDNIPSYAETLKLGSEGDQVRRVQRRLHLLGYLKGAPDGQYGELTRLAVAYFQKRSSLTADGVCGEETQNALFSANAAESDQYVMPYMLIVDISDQRVYAVSFSGGTWETVARKMKCSTGEDETPTPLGTFTNTARGEKWHYFTKWECWAQYAFYIQGDILFHSVLFDSNDESTLRESSVRHLGSKASHGCIRLSVQDAKWIWENCPSGTTVHIRQ